MSPYPPLAYSVRVSRRAKSVRLVVNPREGLVVVVPVRWRGDIGAIVESKRLWAERALARVADSVAMHAAGAEALLPDSVELRMQGESLNVDYPSGLGVAAGGRARVVRRAGTLAVTGGADAEERLAALSRWLDREARARLPIRLGELSDVHGLHPARVRVSRARTRWGSCSSRGTITLNRALLFLPPHLTDALMLHELAHLDVLDHSGAFWRRLEALDPSARAHRRELARAVSLVPPWADR